MLQEGFMKRYKCVFAYARGRTTIEVAADDAEAALRQASVTVSDAAEDVEVWDETGVVLQRRHWRSGSAGPPEG